MTRTNNWNAAVRRIPESHFFISKLLVLLVLLGAVAAANESPYDIVITGGRVVDGTGAPWYSADVAITDGRIAKIGQIDADTGSTVINATGLIVAPGFIDMMGQTATPMVDDPKTAINLLTQGITTINAGEGSSAAPLDEEVGRRRGWTTMAEYFALAEMRGLPVNVVQTVGHTQVRRIVLGDVERRPTGDELTQMQELVREAMEAGAIGVSTALIYPPAVYAETEEIAALAEVAGQYGGRYYTHMRNEGDQLLEAIDEALEIGRQGHTPVHIFHLKAAGQQNWGKMQLAIAKIKAARAAGEQVTADIYPYVNNGLGIAAMIHPRHFTEGFDVLRNRLDDPARRQEIRREMESVGGWENWFRHVGQDWDRVVIGQTNVEEYSGLDGRTVAAIAAAKDEDPWDVFFQLVRAGAFALPQSMTDANKILAMQQPFVSFCTDVGPAGGSRSASHPRAFGSFPRLLSRYVRDLGAISLERAVAQASAAAANDVLAYDRGRISEGLAADMIVFDYENLTDKADFADPHAVSEGVQHVVVNGQLVLHNGKMTDARPGRILRGPGHDASTSSHAVTTGIKDERLAEYDRLIREFMIEHRVPGLSVAVTNAGKLMMARGYGYADIAAKEQVRPTSLFRIASISKPITAVAILQLVEQGKLKLDDKVFDVLDTNLSPRPRHAGATGPGLIRIPHELASWARRASAPAFRNQTTLSTGESRLVQKRDEPTTQGRGRRTYVTASARNDEESKSPDPRLADITIRHLLQHRGGWDRDASFDAMFKPVEFANQLSVPPPADQETVINAMLSQSLDFDPGERYAYSNFGYCLLGRVIEKLTGETYEDYVKQNVLAPLGITSLKIGATRLPGRAENEVRYYQPGNGDSVFADDLGEDTPWPYGAWHLEAMDSHGGWLASAVDLARFGSAFDDPDNCPILSKASIELMHERPAGLAGYEEDGTPKERFYSLGWSNRVTDDGINHWHTGSLNGTATILIRRHDGKNFVALMNGRVSPSATHLGRAIDQLLHDGANAVEEWPEQDRFGEFFNE